MNGLFRESCALASLAHAVDGIDAGFELDLAEIDLKEALEALDKRTQRIQQRQKEQKAHEKNVRKGIKK